MDYVFWAIFLSLSIGSGLLAYYNASTAYIGYHLGLNFMSPLTYNQNLEEFINFNVTILKPCAVNHISITHFFTNQVVMQYGPNATAALALLNSDTGYNCIYKGE